MATLECCGGKRNAYRNSLVTEERYRSDYTYQILLHLKKLCPKCGQMKMQWRGQMPDSTLSEWYDIDEGAYAQWLRRIPADQAKPEPQLMSEWAERMARPADVAIVYHTRLCQAHKWYRGERVKRSEEDIKRNIAEVTDRLFQRYAPHIEGNA